MKCTPEQKIIISASRDRNRWEQDQCQPRPKFLWESSRSLGPYDEDCLPHLRLQRRYGIILLAKLYRLDICLVAHQDSHQEPRTRLL